MNNKIIQITATCTALTILILCVFWLCWEGFMVAYLGFRMLDIPELLSLFGLYAFGVAAIGLLVELARDRK